MPASARRTVRGVRLPSETNLNIVTLLGALRKLETTAIETAVDVLIAELDCRAGDPDLEDEMDEDSE